jgi:hypothetical protein
MPGLILIPVELSAIIKSSILVSSTFIAKIDPVSEWNDLTPFTNAHSEFALLWAKQTPPVDEHVLLYE